MANICRRRASTPVVLGLLAASAAGAACAGSTVGSGVGDRWLERSPYYAGRAAGQATIGHLPVHYQRGAIHSAIFDPAAGEETAIGALLEEMNAFLDSLGATAKLVPPGPARGTPPDVLFGCNADPSGECDREEVARERAPRMRLAVARPSGAWIEWARQALDEGGAEHALLLTLEFGQYWPRQTNLRGSKEVELGTDHAVALPWLTALDAPVAVLQITGALLDRDGRAVRIGAEGLMAKRTNLLLSSFGVQELISGEDVARLRSLRRDDLPGQPLVWQTALRNLLAGLSGRHDVAAR